MYTVNTLEVNMNKSILSMGILLSLGTVGCAGLGTQNSPTLASLAGPDSAPRALDSLWDGSEEAPSGGAEVPRYGDQELGALWENGRNPVSGVVEVESTARGSDLWNVAPVRSGEGHSPSLLSRTPASNGHIGILQF